METIHPSFMNEIIRRFQVNIPFTTLYETHLPRFLQLGINPEIGFDAAALDQFTKADYEDTAKKFFSKNLTITLHAPFMDLNPGSPDSSIRDVVRHRFHQFSDLIPIFHPKNVVCHTGWDDRGYRGLKEEWIQYSLDLWSWLAERTRKQGSLLVLENVYENDPDDFLDLFQRLKDLGFGFCLDTGHQADFGRVPLSNWLDSFGSHIRQVHLHDNHGDPDEHLALGRGNIDFLALFKWIKNKTANPLS
jgi:sugar phosphate isomerase/epimerase